MPAKAALTFHQGATETTPEEVEYNPERLKLLDSHLLGLVETQKLQCASYLLWRHGKTFACKAFGKLNYHDDSPDLMPDSIRWIASLTKTFTSIAIMKLVEDGKLYLSQPVSTIIGEFDKDVLRTITILHLLTHTSGLRADPGYFLEPYPMPFWRFPVEKEIEKDKKSKWIEMALAGPLHAKPGESWVYSSLGMAMLGEVINRVSGMQSEQFIIERITTPLGMNETFFDIPERLHYRVCFTNQWDEGLLNSRTDREANPPRTDFGMSSTLCDMNRLGQMLLNKGEYSGTRVLSRKTVEEMTTNQLSGIDAYSWGKRYTHFPYGLGVFLDRDSLVTPGVFYNEGAGRSAFYVDPVESFIACFFVPTRIDWVPESLFGTKSIIWSGLL